jgi:hypothetical protein
LKNPFLLIPEKHGNGAYGKKLSGKNGKVDESPAPIEIQ